MKALKCALANGSYLGGAKTGAASLLHFFVRIETDESGRKLADDEKEGIEDFQ